MRLPWELERASLLTPLGADECRLRLASRVMAWRRTDAPSGAARIANVPVRGWVRARWFYLGRANSPQTPPRTWVRGRIAKSGEKLTRIRLVIGPSAILGSLSIVLFALLTAGAMILTLLALTTPFAPVRFLVLAWTVVVTFAAVFFVLPELDFEKERTFLVDFLTTALDAREEPQISRRTARARPS